MSIFVLLLLALSAYLTSPDQLIINNSLSFSEEQTDCYIFTLKSQLYNKLKQDPSLRQSSPYNNFYSTTSSSSIGNFWIVDSLIFLLRDTSLSPVQKATIIEDALYENNRISVTEVFETNLKSVNEIYLNTIAEGVFSFTSNQVNDLFDIADQCPYVGGTAVFKARSLYSIIDGTVYFDDGGDLCSSSSKMSDSTVASGSQITYLLYPNPSNTNVTFDYNIAELSSAEVVICDVLERDIKSFPLTTSLGKISLNVSTWASGMYYLKIFSDSQLLVTDKLIIVK